MNRSTGGRDADPPVESKGAANGFHPGLRDLGRIAALDVRRPDRIAIRKGEVTIDRGTLAQRVTALAGRLAGTPEGSIVGLRIGNEPAFVVALLAALSARRTVVAIDPRWGDDEARRAVERVDLSLLLHVGEDPGFWPVAWRLEPTGELVDGDPASVRASRDEAPRDTAVVHWSSGSTGRPHAIVVSRAALAFRFRGLVDGFALTPADRMLCLVPLTHSHGLDSILMPTLASGAELVLLDPMAATPERVVAEIAAERVTVFSAFPRFYDDLLATSGLSSATFASVRLPLCGSAALDPSVARGFRDRFGVGIVTGYGLTEIGVVAMSQLDDASQARGAVGRIMEGIDCRLADQDGEGVGELWVRSPGAAAGYLRVGEEGLRIRRGGWVGTEDLVRIDDDGYLTIVGRKSRFINVDGAKVDPEEIERVIEELAFVEGAAVKGASATGATGSHRVRGAHQRAPGERIVAYVVPAPEASPDSSDGGGLEAAVRRHVAERLAIHKVPSAIVAIAELPRNTLGKILYSELPAPGSTRRIDRRPADATPRTEAEREVARIWAEVLKLESVGARDHFIALGGTSLHLTQIHQRLVERFGKSLRVVDLFRYPTVQAQAAFLSEATPSHAVERARQRARLRRERRLPGAGRPDEPDRE